MAGIAVALCLGASEVVAQSSSNTTDQGSGQSGGGGGRRNRGGNFDPAQMQQRMMERMKETLEVTNDDEWKALQPLIQKVMDARMAVGGGFGRGMFRGPRPGADNVGDQQRPRFGPQPSAEQEALQKAIDAKASATELKAAMTKYVESRKVKQAELEKAQADLRKVLTVRQEAIATLNGLL